MVDENTDTDEAAEIAALAQCFMFLNGSDRIAITPIGIAKFQKEFGEIGVDIKKIKTKAEFLAAHNRVFAKQIRKLRGQSNDPKLKAILDNLFDEN